MKKFSHEERIAQADQAVAAADRKLHATVQALGSAAAPRLTQIGVTAVTLGAVGMFLLRRGRRSGSRLARAVDYAVLLPLAANVIPRIITMIAAQPTLGTSRRRDGARRAAERWEGEGGTPQDADGRPSPPAT